MLIPLKFRQPQFFTDLVVANAQLLNLLVRHVNLLAGLEIHAVDDAMRMDVFTVGVGADEDFTALKVSGKLPHRFVGCAWVNVRAAWEALHHVIKHHAAVFVVPQLRTQKLVERRFRLAADSTDELLSIPEHFIFLCHIPHHAFHAAA